MVAWWLLFGEVNPEPGGGERQKDAGHLVVKNEWFEGCCDAGDAINGEECIISTTRGSGGHGKRTDCSCGSAQRRRHSLRGGSELAAISSLSRELPPHGGCPLQFGSLAGLEQMASCTPCGVPFSVQQLDLATDNKGHPTRYSEPSVSNTCNRFSLLPRTPPHRECPLQSGSQALNIWHHG